MKRDRFYYLNNCVHLPGEFISQMVEHSREVTYRTFMSHVDRNQVENLFPQYIWPGGCQSNGLYLKKDWAVSYHKSRYRGHRCYYLCHSSIEYVFICV